MKTRVTTLLAVLALLLLQDDASACSCAELTPCQAFGYASAVFIGRVIEGTEKVSEQTKDGKTISYEAGRVRFAVQESFKGVNTTELTIHVVNMKGTSCEGTSVGRGERYLVYAHSMNSHGLAIGPCSPSKRLEAAQADLDFLRNLPQPGVGGRLYGQVGVETGAREPAPLSGITIVIEDEERRQREVKTGKDGNYQIDNLTPGKYLVKPVLPQHYSARDEYQVSREVEIADRGCTYAPFWVKADGRLAGRVTDLAGRGAPADMILDSIEGEDRRLVESADQDGEFEFDGVPPGRYVLYLRVRSAKKGGSEKDEQHYYPGSFDREKAQIIEVGLGKKVSGYDFSLPQKLKVQIIEGFVKSADGTPAANIQVLVSIEDTKTPGIYRTYLWPDNVTTDEHGRFKIHGFKGNTYGLWAREDLTLDVTQRRKPLRSELVKLKLDKDITDITLTLSQTGDPREGQRVQSQKKTP